MRRSDGLHSLSFACRRNPSRGWLARRVLLPFVSFQDWQVQILPIIVYFYKVISTHWIFAFAGLSSVSDLGIHLRDTIFGALLRINVSNVIRGGSKVIRDSSANFLSLKISARAAEVFFLPDLLRGLLYCRRVDILLLSCLASFFGLMFFPKMFPVFSGL